MNTLQASVAWPVQAEKKAMNKLATFITPDIFDQYFLTGHFSEQSKRSQLISLELENFVTKLDNFPGKANRP